MAETEFFKADNVMVTNARFVVGSKVFAMSGVTSVDTRRVEPKKGGPFICIGIGALICLGSLGSLADGGIVGLLLGIALIAGGVFVLKGQKATLFVFLMSGSGENEALSSIDQDYITKIVAALNEAMIHRG